MIRTPRYKYYFAISDLLILTVSFLLSYLIIAQNTALKLSSSGRVLPGVLLFAALSFLIIAAFEKNDLYKINVILKRKLHLTALLKSLVFASALTFLVFIVFYWDSFSALSLMILFFVFSSSLIFSFMRIELYRRMILQKRNNELFRKKILVIGAGKSGRIMTEYFQTENPYGTEVIGFLDDNYQAGAEIITGKRILGDMGSLRNVINNYYVDEAVITSDDLEYEKFLEILDDIRGLNISVIISSERFSIVQKKFSKEKYGNYPVVDITPTFKSRTKIKVKRIIDIIGSAAGLILLSPILVLIVLLIKLTSQGPILFKQTRIGHNGKPFTFFKFRSMYVINGEDEERKKKMLEFMNGGLKNVKETKVINDKRVTWIGKYIRKTSLDELPQLFNVLKGDMSLVGPRPCLPYEYDNYKNWQKRRVDVVPGCTGVWQVSGRSQVSFNDSILLDLYYINNLSLWFDLKLLLMTLPVMFFSKGGK